MNEEYMLSELNSSWATFKPIVVYGSDRQFTLSTGTWKEMGRPISLLVTVEGLTPTNKKER